MAFGKNKGKAKGRFEYKARDADAYAARASVGGMREGFIVEGVKMFAPKAGSHSVRILPPTWDDPEHYGLDAYVHYDIGPDGGTYLCLEKMKDETCAICDERKRAIGEGEEELADALRWTRRVLCWVIDRNNEKDGPLLWSMPQSLDKDIAAVCQDKKTGEVYSPDDPNEGYDVSFEREGTQKNTKYSGVQLDRKSSPLSDDDDDMAEWLEFVKENPVPEQLVFQDADYIETLVSGGMAQAGAKRRKEREEESKGGKRSRPNFKKDKDEGDERRSSKDKGKKDADMTWDEVHDLDEDELVALAEEHEIDVSKADNEEEAADIICKELDIDKPAKKKSRDADDDDDKDKKKKRTDDDDDKGGKKPLSKLEQMRQRRRNKE